MLLGGLRPAALSGSEEGTETSILFIVGLVEASGGGGIVGGCRCRVWRSRKAQDSMWCCINRLGIERRDTFYYWLDGKRPFLLMFVSISLYFLVIFFSCLPVVFSSFKYWNFELEFIILYHSNDDSILLYLIIFHITEE